jgi:Ku70/Ku80 beta-barrel domain
MRGASSSAIQKRFAWAARGFAWQRADKNHLAIARAPSGTRWKGYLKLSLVSCPVQLFPAISEREKIRFHQINKKDRKPDQILQARCRDRQADQRRAAIHHQRTSANRSTARARKAS